MTAGPARRPRSQWLGPVLIGTVVLALAGVLVAVRLHRGPPNPAPGQREPGRTSKVAVVAATLGGAVLLVAAVGAFARRSGARGPEGGQDVPPAGATLYLNADRLSVRQLRLTSASFGHFLLYLAKRLIRVPIGYSPLPADWLDTNLLPHPDPVPPELAAEVDRIVRDHPDEGFTLVECYQFPGGGDQREASVAAALLSADGRLGLLVAWEPADAAGFTYSCLSFGPGDRPQITYGLRQFLADPPTWDVSIAAGPQLAAILRHHRSMLRGRAVRVIRPDEVRGLLVALMKETLAYNVQNGVLDVVEPDPGADQAGDGRLPG